MFRFGISFLGGKFSEEKLIGYAYAFEQMSQAREQIKPVVQPKTELRDILANKTSEPAQRTPEMPIQWIQNTELVEVPAQARLLLENSGNIPPGEIMSHINEVVSEIRHASTISTDTPPQRARALETVRERLDNPTIRSSNDPNHADDVHCIVSLPLSRPLPFPRHSHHQIPRLRRHPFPTTFWTAPPRHGLLRWARAAATCTSGPPSSPSVSFPRQTLTQP